MVLHRLKMQHPAADGAAPAEKDIRTKLRAARGATNDAPLRRTAGAAACARAWGPAVAAPSGQSKCANAGR
ncbi:MAG: hypothetical protein CMN60_14115 [Sphingobium sp.]|nr:hypothetical protein [Sphingobium sp.]